MFSDAWFYIMASEMNGVQVPFSWDPLTYSLVKPCCPKPGILLWLILLLSLMSIYPVYQVCSVPYSILVIKLQGSKHLKIYYMCEQPKILSLCLPPWEELLEPSAERSA